MMIRQLYCAVILIFSLLVEVHSQSTNNTFADVPIKPADYQKIMGNGFDVSWVTFPKRLANYNEQMVIDIANKGFSNIRFRTEWEANDASLFNYLDTMVVHCLKHNLIPIIAYTADSVEDEATEEDKQTMINWWRVVTQHYKNYSHKISFDLFLEIDAKSPLCKNDGILLNEWYNELIPAIRKIDSTRILFLSPIKRADPRYLNTLVIPDTTDKYIMIQWHFYASGPSKTVERKLWTTGTPEEKEILRGYINTALAWTNAHGLYSWVGAWMPGNYNYENYYSVVEQVNFTNFMVSELKKNGIPWSVNAIHKYYNAEQNMWIGEMQQIIEAMLNPTHVFKEKTTYGFNLFPANPNPFNFSTIINFQIPKDGFVSLTVYNLIGKKIKVIVNEERKAGTYSECFYSTDLASGIYVSQLVFGDALIKAEKMILLK